MQFLRAPITHRMVSLQKLQLPGCSAWYAQMSEKSICLKYTVRGKACSRMSQSLLHIHITLDIQHHQSHYRTLNLKSLSHPSASPSLVLAQECVHCIRKYLQVKS